MRMKTELQLTALVAFFVFGMTMLTSPAFAEAGASAAASASASGTSSMRDDHNKNNDDHPIHSITPNRGCNFHPDSDRCKPDNGGNCPSGFAHNEKGNCHPSGKCPSGFSRHTDDESGKCFSNRSHGHDNHNTKTIVVHHTNTKVQKVKEPATVFVPGLGLVQPFNCKLNAANNKIGCQFVIIDSSIVN